MDSLRIELSWQIHPIAKDLHAGQTRLAIKLLSSSETYDTYLNSPSCK